MKDACTALKDASDDVKVEYLYSYKREEFPLVQKFQDIEFASIDRKGADAVDQNGISSLLDIKMPLIEGSTEFTTIR